MKSKIKTVEDACKYLGLVPKEAIPSYKLKKVTELQKGIRAFAMLQIINRALNENWVADWTDTNQYKYWPYFNMASGVGFSRTYYGYWSTRTYVGSRLCFKTEELAKYAGKQFIDIYREFLTIK